MHAESPFWTEFLSEQTALLLFRAVVLQSKANAA
jgi:hypothetical protein